MQASHTILGIETSCDETAVAVYSSEQGLLAHQLHSQIAMHAEYGGVVPELASRDHIQKLSPMITEVLKKAKISLNELTGIAYTKGPGLVGALLVGATVARSLGFALKIPTIGVHHMEAHLLAPMLEENPPGFPLLALLVSGGHTLLVQVNNIGEYKLLGESLDDAVGEALDKTAKLLGLPYPGGPQLEKLATQGNPERFRLPRPMTDRPGLDFSFSGLKTLAWNILQNPGTYELHQASQNDNLKADLAFAFQDAVTDVLVIKSQRALQQTHLKTLVVAGGVSANQTLRQKMQIMAEKLNINVFYPRHEFCTDNAAMVAYAGFRRMQLGQFDKDLKIEVLPRWPL